MISLEPLKSGNIFDIILISGEYWADHPHSGVGVIARVLEDEGFSVGVVEKPDWTDYRGFLKLGMPRLFFGITSGAVDSMLQNYTPLKNLRKEDRYNPYESGIPDRAVIVYTQKVKRAQNAFLNEQGLSKKHKKPIVLGGVEASLRRFTHYDYWDNDVRRPILLDAKADVLVYGPGEFQIRQIAKRLDELHENTHLPTRKHWKRTLDRIPGTCIVKTAEDPLRFHEEDDFVRLPSHQEALKDPKKFCEMQNKFTNQANLVQKVKNRKVVQYKQHAYTSEELDALYELPFSYHIPEKYEELEMAQFSIITHRGCIGNCNFCAIRLHQGEKIVSRSPDSILKEISRMKEHEDFKGYVDDIGGPSANMYGMDCEISEFCKKECINCSNLDRSHRAITNLLENSRKIEGVEKTFVRSGIRYDIALDAEEGYLKELIEHHISGYLKIAPEHFAPHICKLMNKSNQRFDEFVQKFKKLNEEGRWILKYYFITAHPGSKMEDARILARKLRSLGSKKTNKIQIFTPTPMSTSTCMYHTGLNPRTMEKVYIPYTYSEKKKQKRILFR